ncbi:hypothetical protein NIASO_00570 [Niabella soli DSM 19437]|uniref:Uncharacterized protein n=1 Tax=Niabella soli DSM 19437 TaxID=929713 RepID=W0F1U5_9BACT|nr:hypothetical protein NIASO_00570 [Niabella soli DSM 19437]
MTFKLKWIVPMALNSLPGPLIRNKFRIYLMKKPLAFCNVKGIIVPNLNAQSVNLEEAWPRFNELTRD